MDHLHRRPESPEPANYPVGTERDDEGHPDPNQVVVEAAVVEARVVEVGGLARAVEAVSGVGVVQQRGVEDDHWLQDSGGRRIGVAPRQPCRGDELLRAPMDQVGREGEADLASEAATQVRVAHQQEAERRSEA